MIRTNNFSATTSFLYPLTRTDDSQTLSIDLKRQPDKPVTAIPTFMRVTMLDDNYPEMTFFLANSPPLKGTRAKRDKRTGK